MPVKREFSMTPERLPALGAILTGTAIDIHRAINDALTSKGDSVINARMRHPGDRTLPSVLLSSLSSNATAISPPGTGTMQKMTAEGGAKGGTDRETKWNVRPQAR